MTNERNVLQELRRLEVRLEAGLKHALSAAATAQELAALIAADVISLAGLVQTLDPAEAEIVRGAVERARRVLGPETAGRH